jgi:hypothetical protein
MGIQVSHDGSERSEEKHKMPSNQRIGGVILTEFSKKAKKS